MSIEAETKRRLGAADAGAKKLDAKRKRSRPALAAVTTEGQQPILTPEGSDDALALKFAVRVERKLRWTPFRGWVVKDRDIWRPDDELSRYDEMRAICRTEAAQLDDEGEARRMTSARTVQAGLTLAQSDPNLVVPSDWWDDEPMRLNVMGGVVDLKDGSRMGREMLETVGMAATYFMQVTRVGSVAGEPKKFLAFLNDVFLGDAEMVAFIQRVLGYCLTGDRREQVLFFFYGSGANGKSVLVELLLYILGSYAIKLPATALMQAKGERHPTEIASLRGRRLAVSSELSEGDFFNEALLKELTGDETMTARFMRQDFFEFKMQHKHLIVGNFKPRLRGGDPAMARRMLLIPFLASFKGEQRDPRMLEKLKVESPLILSWMVEGARIWARDGLKVPESVRAASAEYMAEHDDLALWVDECCARDGEAKANDLYASFADWKKARGEHAASMTVWGSRLTLIPGITKRRSGGIKYSGVRLTLTEQERLNAKSRWS